MQIRYLEAMQSMAKSANSKVIFLPAMNQSVVQQGADNAGEGPSRIISGPVPANVDDGFQRAINSQVVENI